jgi:hypothetical protein
MRHAARGGEPVDMTSITSVRGPRAAAVPLDRALRRLTAVLGVLAFATGLLWVALPALGPYGTDLAPVSQLGWPEGARDVAAAALQAIAGAVLCAVALSARRAAAAGAGLALAAAIAIGVGLVGFDGIPVAGYSFAFLVPIGAAVALVAFAVRRPVVGVPVLAVAAILLVLGQVTGILRLPDFYVGFVGAMADDAVRFWSCLALVLLAGVSGLWAVREFGRRAGRAGAFVERHRVAFAVAAAACALPYVIARASWLTPWPLFGGGAEAFSEEPLARTIGLMLGAAMFAGGVLTLGLAMPWGTTFPRWVPGVGGRPVPVPLAVVPAAIVAALFTAGGIQLLGLALNSPVSGNGLPSWAMAVVLPFWAWGPLLALATWGYARHRAASE